MAEKSRDKEEKGIPMWACVGGVAAVLVIVTCIIGWCNRSASEGSFTIINSIFSGLAFVMLIIAIFMQRDELQLQRKDLELQRNEMELTRAEFEKQNKTLSRQRFENTFFQLLQRQSEIRSAIEARDDGGNVLGNGLDTFKNLYEILEKEIVEIKKQKIYSMNSAARGIDLPAELKRMAIETVITTSKFVEIFKRYENDLGHYFNHLITLIRFVVDTNVDVAKERYLDFIKSELSLYERLCIFYYGLSDYGLKEFKGLLLETPILKGIDEKKLIDVYHIAEYQYPDKKK